RGASRSSGELLLICNSDVTVEDGAVVALAAAMDADERFGVVGPRIMDPDGSLYPSPRRFPAMGVALGHAFLGLFAPRNRYTRRYRMLDWQQQPGPVDWVSGACFMCRRDAWDSLGGLDEAYFLYAEDVDLCWRAWKAGWKVGFEPAARVTHIGGATTSLAPYRFIVLHHRSALRFSRRYLTGWRQVLLPFTTIGLGVRLVLACAQRAARGLRDH
ncbi:MAG: glycosyltransferase family 2 protein, partial [Actinomycetota bacterium]|nr:glycosyltransferase family 2 protein [Actinomycetota bacterium]